MDLGGQQNKIKGEYLLKNNIFLMLHLNHSGRQRQVITLTG